MHCKICNTPAAGASHCPNCGTAIKAPSKVRSSGNSSDSEPLPLVDALELTDPGITDPESPAPERENDEKPETPSDSTQDARGVRTLLAEHPQSLESGLVVLTDESGASIGIDYSTEVGSIDLLARDGRNAYVVVMVASVDQSEAVIRDILQRIGWVRKHLAHSDERVRGTVLLEKRPTDLSYLAAAVADTVAFKTYRLSLAFDDLDV